MKRQLLRLPEITERLGVSRATVYKLIKDDRFPRPAKLGASSVWDAAEVSAWVGDRLRERLGPGVRYEVKEDDDERG